MPTNAASSSSVSFTENFCNQEISNSQIQSTVTEIRHPLPSDSSVQLANDSSSNTNFSYSSVSSSTKNASKTNSTTFETPRMQIPELLNMVFGYLGPADLFSCALSDHFMGAIAAQHLRKHAVKDYQGLTALCWASKMGHDTLVKYLIEQNHDLEQRSGFRLQINPFGCDDPTDGMTAIHFAAAAGHEDVVQRLLRAGANTYVVGNRLLDVSLGTIPCHTTVKGCTPLHAAAANGHTSIVKLFLAMKHPVDSIGGYNTGDGISLPAPQRCTPLHCAVGGGHSDTTKLLLEAGANPNSDTMSGDLSDDNLETSIRPIHLAAWGGHVEIARLLWKRAKYTDSLVDVYGSCNSLDNYKFRPLDLALEKSDSERHQDVAAFLKSKGARRKAMPSKKDIHTRGGIRYSLSRRQWWSVDDAPSISPAFALPLLGSRFAP